MHAKEFEVEIGQIQEVHLACPAQHWKPLCRRRHPYSRAIIVLGMPWSGYKIALLPVYLDKDHPIYIYIYICIHRSCYLEGGPTRQNPENSGRSFEKLSLPRMALRCYYYCYSCCYSSCFLILFIYVAGNLSFAHPSWPCLPQRSELCRSTEDRSTQAFPASVNLAKPTCAVRVEGLGISIGELPNSSIRYHMSNSLNASKGIIWRIFQGTIIGGY